MSRVRLNSGGQKIKRQVIILFLGGKCSCPGNDCWHEGPCRATDMRCLQLDHINGGGNQEVQSGGQNAMINRYWCSPDLAKKRLQVLCANCNWVKRHTHDEVRGGKGIPESLGLLDDMMDVERAGGI